MMSSLAVLDLSNNSLTGSIPVNFGNSPALESFNVSHNNLEGPVPENGILKTINTCDLIGNSGLCGAVLPPCSGNPIFKKSHLKHTISGWLITLSTIIALVVAGIMGRKLYKKRFHYNNSECPWRLTSFQRLGFSNSDVITCLNESNVIGTGANGVVYKAELATHKTVIAVKKLWRSSDNDDIVREVNILSGLRHRNIVRLLGFLYNDNTDDAMIIYEYMPNGSLWEALHEDEQARNSLIDWVSRYDIAMGVAHGLAYLHHDCYPPVIHRDIKSNNILLDENVEAKIADFGLAKMVTKNETVSVVVGSYGYIAPEYGYTLKIDEKTDIYSYGVVLMELVTGKKPLDHEFTEEVVDIVEWIHDKIRYNRPLDSVLDKNIGITIHVHVEMLLVLKIALLCTSKLPKDRPSMRDIITMLVEAKPRRENILCNQ